MPCPKCGSIKKSDVFGSMHSHGPGISTYSHTCGKCHCHFQRTYDYKNDEERITANGKVISINKESVPKLKAAIKTHIDKLRA